MKEELKELAKQFPIARLQFEMEVEGTCLEITAMAKEISPAIGEISVNEAKEVIIREFIKRLHEPFYHAVYTGKK